MVRFKKKFLFLNVVENWFHCDPSGLDMVLPNAYLHVKDRAKKLVPGFSDITYTVENDLTQDHDTIYAGFLKSLRQQIRQSEELGITCSFHNDVDGFVRFFNEFAASKNLAPTSIRRMEEMKAFIHLSYAMLDGEVLVAHSTLVDEKNKIARAFHSASKRLDDSFDKNLIGKANKVLHYRDMMHFKELGYTVYDFGGYTENTEDKALQGINTFKLSFGGQKVACRNYYTVSYYLLRKLGQWMGALGKG